MSCEELQEEEREVLLSIYDGDKCFRQLSSTSFQYKIGEDDNPKSFLLEISWVSQYPNVPPTINLDAFYNKKLIPEVKSAIINKLLEEAGMQIGTPMTYTLFELAKDNAEELTKLQPECLISPEEETAIEAVSAKKEKKPQLSKQQKRRLAERLDAKGERPRGWDWVDVVKHLSQIGSKTDTT
ncbi:RWD domain-containing protein 4 [Trichonephila clavata]|uniref:RWD domain-containing protein 4 n=2 Tax=Trichonephila clavata TaxID=2740835 RepID=A0A8X6LR30_TRICU|nr:RWD domain-containing protein 4 [Trichonephila clavata]